MKKTYLHSEQRGQPQQWLYWFYLLSSLFSSGLYLTGCQGPVEKNQPPQAVIIGSALDDTDKYIEFTEPPVPRQVTYRLVESTEQAADLWERIRFNMRLLDYEHPRITHEIERLQRHPAALSILLNRAEPYLYHIVGQVEQQDLPTEIALLPAVESGFIPSAHSPNGAAGLWQFMPATGRMLGLEQHWWYDGRRCVIASTDAALEYLTRLNRGFDGDWLYALAAYNAGSGTVNRAIRRAREEGQPEDYWSLELPRETQNYIPRLIALAKIIYDPAAYSLSLPQLDNAPYFEITESQKPLDLKVAAKLAGVPLTTLRNLNPAFKHGVTHPASSNQLLLPIGKRLAFHESLAALPDTQRLKWRRHKVSRGETLNKIAHRYKLPVSAIRKANNLSGNRIRAKQKLLIPPSQSATIAATQRKKTKPKLRYRVRKGDSLYAIARKFQVEVNDLKRWNKVGKHLYPGQRLTVYVKPT